MSNDNVRVPGLSNENAILLLEAAEGLDLSPSVVRTSSRGGFLVPKEVADKAGVDYDSPDSTSRDTSSYLVGDDGETLEESQERAQAEIDKTSVAADDQPKAAKKTAAKKATARKSTSGQE